METEVGETNDEDRIKILESHVAQLMEHFDAVHVFVSRYNGEQRNTDSWNSGSGNYHARRGHVVSWMIQQDATDKHEANRRLEDSD